MGRQRGAPIYRIDINGPFRVDDPLLAELRAEANARGVSLQQHIYDLLRARYLARRGQALSDLLWIPGAPAAAERAVEMEPSADMAASAAGAWLDLLEA
jgi:hypothetical protein